MTTLARNQRPSRLARAALLAGLALTARVATAADTPRQALGRSLFFDPALSTPAGTSCASCHDPAHGYAGNHGSATGVAAGATPALLAKRNTPSVRYLQFVPPFYFHWDEDAPEPDAFGGLFWDGRADTIAQAVQQPLLNPLEMANPDAAAVMATLQKSAYRDAFYAAFPGAAGDATKNLAAIGDELEAFLTTEEMAPFSSKYDDVLRGKATWTAQEQRGLALFKDPQVGGCAECHKLNDTSSDPKRSLFTDFGFEAPGVPRNRLLPVNADAKTFDLGLCARGGNPLVAADRLCGQFRTPSLRNVATRAFFMHNGVFTSLRDVVSFYATRAVTPSRWYPATAGVFDDVPSAYFDNIDVTSVPYNQPVGATPRLDDADIDAIVAFLTTLNDAEYR